MVFIIALGRGWSLGRTSELDFAKYYDMERSKLLHAFGLLM